MEYKVFGCKVNKYYTDQWLNSEYLKDKTGIFIASCVVTDKAKNKWIKFVKDSAKNTSENIYISGCGTFKDGIVQDNFFELYPELNYLKNRIITLGEKPVEIEKKIINSKEISENNNKINKFKLSKIPQIYTKKFLLIQGGCDSFCSFCLTVKKRGKHYYRDKQDIVDEIIEFEKTGGKEVVLTGINLSAWGLETTNPIYQDLEKKQIYSRFSELIEYILENTKIPRIRISSLGPEFVDKKCLELFKNIRIYPHFHYSVQSGSTKILKSMNRHYDGEYIKELLQKTKNIKRKDGVEISIGADLIIGFPGETEVDFEETLNLVKTGLITKIHAFPFSGHTKAESVPAGKFPDQIDDKTKKERMWKLEYEAEKIRDDFINKNIGKKIEVLIEIVKDENGKIKWKGWTQNYIEANEKTFEIISGKLEKNEIVSGVLKK